MIFHINLTSLYMEAEYLEILKKIELMSEEDREEFLKKLEDMISQWVL